MRTGTVGGFLAALLSIAPPADGQETEWPFHGFVQTNWSVRVTGADASDLLSEDFLVGEDRVQLELERYSPRGRVGFLVKTDVCHDAVSDRADLEVREAYLDLDLGSMGLRLGRQIITWGLGDLLFINDVFPKDWGAFFGGRPAQYLKVGVDAVRADFASGSTSADLVVVPVFEPDRVPSPERFSVPDPFDGLPRIEDRPEPGLANAQIALRMRRRLGGVSLAVYGYRGFYGAPAPRPEGVEDASNAERILQAFPPLSVYGVSARRSGFGGVVSAEFGYYDSRDDRPGTDPWIPNSDLQLLLGYQRQLWSESQLGLQYYVEWMRDHPAYRRTLPQGMDPRDEARHTTTLRYVQPLAYRTWQLSLFVFAGLSEGDYLAIPEIQHRVTEELWAALGANLFGGGRQDMFGALDDNDNLYLTVRYGF